MAILGHFCHFCHFWHLLKSIIFLPSMETGKNVDCVILGPKMGYFGVFWGILEYLRYFSDPYIPSNRPIYFQIWDWWKAQFSYFGYFGSFLPFLTFLGCFGDLKIIDFRGVKKWCSIIRCKTSWKRAPSKMASFWYFRYFSDPYIPSNRPIYF